MQFAGRWVPLEVMNTVFVLWLLAAAILVGLVVYLNRRHARSKRRDKQSAERGRHLRKKKR